MQLTSITANVIFTIALIIITCLLTMLSKKIKVAYPILLVVAGLVLSFDHEVCRGYKSIPTWCSSSSCHHYCTKLPSARLGKSYGDGGE